MRVNSVTIKGFHNVEDKTYSLSDLSYLHGPNGAGKSTVMQAIQLALLGYIPGTNKTKEAIYRHANNSDMSVRVELLDNGNSIEIHRSWRGTTKGTISDFGITPATYDIKSILTDLELPIFNFSEFIGMTANKLKDWFLAFLPKSDDSIDWEKVLTESIKGINVLDPDLISTTVNEIKQFKSSGLENVRSVHDHFKSILSFKKGELQRIQSTILSLIHYDDYDASESVEELKSKIKYALKLRDAYQREQFVLNERDKISKQIQALNICADCVENDERYKELIKKSNELSNDIVSLSLERDSLHREFLKLTYSKDEKNSIISGCGICPYTQKSCESISSLVSKYSTEVEDLDKDIKEKQELIDKLYIQINLYRSQNRAFDEEIKSIASKYLQYDVLKHSLADLPEFSNVVIDIDSIQSNIDRWTDMIAKVEANQKYNSMIDGLTRDKYVIEQTIEIYKVWIKLTDVNGLQTDLMLAPFESFGSQMSLPLTMFFGTDVTAKFNLSAKANSFSFGIVRDNKYVPFDLLSSGEKCLFTFALMICIVNKSSSPLKLIMVDDLLDHLDDDAIERLFQSLYTMKHIQFILAGVKDMPRISNWENIVTEVNSNEF